MKKKQNKKLLIVIIILIVIITDQLIKEYISNNIHSEILIKNVLNLSFVKNTGGAYGIGNNNVMILIILNIIIIGVLIAYVFIKEEQLKTNIIIFISIIIAGGMSNLIDRIFRGFVIDYIDINPLFKYPVFNFADICIVCGAILIIIDLIINKNKQEI